MAPTSQPIWIPLGISRARSESQAGPIRFQMDLVAPTSQPIWIPLGISRARSESQAGPIRFHMGPHGFHLPTHMDSFWGQMVNNRTSNRRFLLISNGGGGSPNGSQMVSQGVPKASKITYKNQRITHKIQFWGQGSQANHP